MSTPAAAVPPRRPRAAMIFVASVGLPTGLGATIAVGSRLVFLLADVLGLALTAPWHRRPVGQVTPSATR